MKRCLGISFVVFCSFLLIAGFAAAKNVVRNELVHDTELDGATDDGTAPISKALLDTVWIADWNFDGGSPCDETGWVKYDDRIVNDSSNYWCVSSAYADSGGIVDKAVVLRAHNLCWAAGSQSGYGNNYDYSLVLKYQGASQLSFDFVSDSEPGFDFVTVESDSLCLSNALVNYGLNPKGTPEEFRDELFVTSGLNTAGSVSLLALSDYGNAAALHCAYIRFEADGGYSDEDGNYPTYYAAGLIVDNIVLDGAPVGAGGLDYSEDFQAASGCGASVAGVNSNITLVNSSPGTPFGEWARAYSHITDNDKCTENATCAWLKTDPARPAFFPDMAFAPNGAVIRNWLEDITNSPWVSLATTPGASGTVLSWRRFRGNRFANGKIVQGWRVRGKQKVNNTDTSTLGDSIDCTSSYGHASNFNSLTEFNWITGLADMSASIGAVAPLATEIQLSLRVGDWQYITGEPAPAVLNTGPGPWDDRVRIGRRVLSGPVISEGIDARSQAQDAFGAVQNAISPGEHHSPSTSATRRFDGVPFDQGTDLAINNASPNLVTGDSIHVSVIDVRLAGGVTSVKLFGAIVSGPHAGKRPPGSTAGPGGFFVINADSARNASGSVVANNWFVDLPDQSLRGGDEVVYFWGAADILGGFTSDPVGIPGDGAGNPVLTSVNTAGDATSAEALTGGLLGMSALPTINWDEAYRAAASGAAADVLLAPDATQIAAATQATCVLYYQKLSSRRRSGPRQRTPLMFTLDRMGYASQSVDPNPPGGGLVTEKGYDVYDITGFGNTNNALGGRATTAHATGYAVIINDIGRLGSDTMEDGIALDAEKIDQAGWFRTWLDAGLTSEILSATAFVLGENTVQEKASNTLFTTYMGCGLGNGDNGSGGLNPDVIGKTNFTFQNGCLGTFGSDAFTLAGGCPAIRNYDGLSLTSGTGTHKYKSGTVESPFYALVMNKNSTLKWNTIMAGFNWGDIRDAAGTHGRPEADFLGKVFACALPAACIQAADPTGVPGGDEIDVPRKTVLYQNVPNPFNPTTKITFDLAREGHVKLQVFDVAGHVMRTLANQKMAAGRNQNVSWNGLDDAGRRVGSGVYFYQLVTDDFTATKKMVLLK